MYFLEQSHALSMPKAVVSTFLNVLLENAKVRMGMTSDAFLIKAMRNQQATFESM
jgi:hypothetical protein